MKMIKNRDFKDDLMELKKKLFNRLMSLSSFAIEWVYKLFYVCL